MVKVVDVVVQVHRVLAAAVGCALEEGGLQRQWRDNELILREVNVVVQHMLRVCSFRELQC